MNRRDLLSGILLAGIAPAFVRYGSLMVPRSVKQGIVYVVYERLRIEDFMELPEGGFSFVIDRPMTQREVIEGIGLKEFIRLSKLVERGVEE